MLTDYILSEQELDAWQNANGANSEGAHLELLQVPWGCRKEELHSLTPSEATIGEGV